MDMIPICILWLCTRPGFFAQHNTSRIDYKQPEQLVLGDRLADPSSLLHMDGQVLVFSHLDRSSRRLSFF